MDLTVAGLRSYDGSQVVIRVGIDRRELIGKLRGVAVASSNQYGAHCELMFDWLVALCYDEDEWRDVVPAEYALHTGAFHAVRREGALVLCPAKCQDLLIFEAKPSTIVFDIKERKRVPHATFADLNLIGPADAA